MATRHEPAILERFVPMKVSSKVYGYTRQDEKGKAVTHDEESNNPRNRRLKTLRWMVFASAVLLTAMSATPAWPIRSAHLSSN